MDIKGLLDVTCKTVANMIKGKTPEEIRRTFNIKNDFTPQEEEQVHNTLPFLLFARFCNEYRLFFLFRFAKKTLGAKTDSTWFCLRFFRVSYAVIVLFFFFVRLNYVAQLYRFSEFHVCYTFCLLSK